MHESLYRKYATSARCKVKISLEICLRGVRKYKVTSNTTCSDTDRTQN